MVFNRGMNMDINKIYNMDCIDGMKQLPENSIDSIVTDPPYGLGFMGKQWDTYDKTQFGNKGYEGKNDLKVKKNFNTLPRYRSDNSFYEFSYIWAHEALRVLKPGGFLLAFGGTRTYHRMASGIEDAGFEIRDQIQWIYGSGFPKSLNIGKAIDKISKNINLFKPFAKYLKEKRINKGLSVTDVSKYFPSKMGGLTGCVSNWELGYNIPTKEQFKILKELLDLNNKFDDLINRIETEREIIGKSITNKTVSQRIGQNNISGKINITKGNSDWEGWGTALKPANEPIVVARKPLSENTVAKNVLKWDTGGINIDASRIGINGDTKHDDSIKEYNNEIYGKGLYKNYGKLIKGLGRFPANVIHDGSDEVVSLFPNLGKSNIRKINKKENININNQIYGKGFIRQPGGFIDSGTPARFFYCAKPSKSERNIGLDKFDSKQLDESRKEGNPGGDNPRNREVNKVKNIHPTVKPLKLMQYLVRLVTPKNGTVLDPFMGSGTTGMASKSQGFNYIGFDMTKEYCDIAEARIKSIDYQKKIL